MKTYFVCRSAFFSTQLKYKLTNVAACCCQTADIFGMRRFLSTKYPWCPGAPSIFRKSQSNPAYLPRSLTIKNNKTPHERTSMPIQKSWIYKGLSSSKKSVLVMDFRIILAGEQNCMVVNTPSRSHLATLHNTLRKTSSSSIIVPIWK